MLDHRAPPAEDFRSRFQARRHAVEHRRVFQPRDLAFVLAAARLDRANESCRFRAVSVAEARAALLARDEEIATTVQSLRSLRRELTSESLFEANLIDGVVDPLDSEQTEGEF